MPSMNRRTVIAGVSAQGAALALTGVMRCAAAQSYPSRPVTIIVPWAAGGGTDAVARIIAGLLEKEFKQPFNVVNRTGGSGVVGHAAIAGAPPDGYTLGMITTEITMLHQQGLTQIKHTSYTPLALIGSDPAGVQVNVDSPYQNLQELADAIKAAPAGKFKASGTGQGGIWHLALINWLTAMRLKPDHVAWVPSNGASAAMQDLAANGLDLVTCSVPEARAMIDARKVRSLAVMSDVRNPKFKGVPTVKEAIGIDIDLSITGWRGVGAPKGLPAELAQQLVTALKRVSESTEYKAFMDNRGFGIKWGDPAAFAKFMAEADAAMSRSMAAAGLKKV